MEDDQCGVFGRQSRKALHIRSQVSLNDQGRIASRNVQGLAQQGKAALFSGPDESLKPRRLFIVIDMDRF